MEDRPKSNAGPTVPEGGRSTARLSVPGAGLDWRAHHDPLAASGDPLIPPVRPNDDIPVDGGAKPLRAEAAAADSARQLAPESAGPRRSIAAQSQFGRPYSPQPRSSKPASDTRTGDDGNSHPKVYGALDLGTNNCRLLLATPSRRSFRVVDAFSRIIRLGEGMAQTGALSKAAMDRTIEALHVCAQKMARHDVESARLVATEACRMASNGAHFLDRVQNEVGLKLEVLSREAEARLAVSGCAALVDPSVDYVLVFDIGGGSSELIWLDLTKMRQNGWRMRNIRAHAPDCILAWTSLKVGVVTLAEQFGGQKVTPAVFEDMVQSVQRLVLPFDRENLIAEKLADRQIHFLGTSGTVTTVAGVHLGLARYDRSKVDGKWLTVPEAQSVTAKLLAGSYEDRVAQPCIGRERADLVLAGCAILEALIRSWPCQRMRVADRGLREGILTTLMADDDAFRTSRRRGMRRRRGTPA